MKLKKYMIYMLVLAMVLSFCACGKSGDKDSEVTEQDTQETETETEFRVEILDAADILVKVWDMYVPENRFPIMGGHFETAVMDMPAKYDMTQTVDLAQMYCVLEADQALLDDVATMVDLYNVGRFTAAAYHVTDESNVETFVGNLQAQVKANQWHGEAPEKLVIVKIDNQYVVSVYGRETLVDGFLQKINTIYQTMVTVMVEEIIF